jgi:CubicO group peptidase (beta-lactamase class C family)
VQDIEAEESREMSQQVVNDQELSEFVAGAAEQFGIPGAAVGIWHRGREIFAGHGVTSTANPLPVTPDTVFSIASTSKTFTSTLVMRLVAEGKIELDAPVQRYVPEFQLSDPDHAARITVMNLLNHTAGLDWNLIDTDEGGDSLAGFVAKMTELTLIAEPGARASYSQAGYNLLGRVAEKVTGLPFEEAVATLLLEPLGLADTVYDLDEAVIRRFAVGHNVGADGQTRLAVPWKAYPAGARGNNPGGGISSTIADLLAWSRFQLGDGAGVLPAEVLHRMQEPTIELRATSLGDAIGICWFIKDIAGVRTISHGGSGNGQFCELLIVPEHDFAVVSLANQGPDGYAFDQAVATWALEHYLCLVEAEPEPVAYDDARAREVAGRYDNDAMHLDIAADGVRLTLAVEIKPEIRAAAGVEVPPDLPPAEWGFLAAVGDEYIVTEGGLKGQRGYFGRDENGSVVSIDLAGRPFRRV